MPAQKHSRASRTGRGQHRANDAWTTLQSGGLQILQALRLTKLPWLVHGFSTRHGGVSELNRHRVLNLGFTDWDTRDHVLANREALLSALGAEGMELVTLRQFHSDVIDVEHQAGQEMGTDAIRPARKGDALVTRLPGLLLAVQTADCVPILLVDPKRRVVAAVHAGWRGTLRRIAAKSVGRMQMEFGTRPGDVIAVLGPAIGRCCYEVGPEVAQAYAGQFARAREWFDGPFTQLAASHDRNPLKWLQMSPLGHDPPEARVRLDLAAANRWQLLEAGVPEAHVVPSNLCTSCRTDLLFSYRREKPHTGRSMGVIGLRVA